MVPHLVVDEFVSLPVGIYVILSLVVPPPTTLVLVLLMCPVIDTQ